ncbi:angiogenic factor with G patch and FHA domains 1 isoform X1 [Genypterus blacodes]|uniref:angiogenic factor with G patch and FHA domains 1 isoform X1 n=1 Tax=Genypterus blacodes TaxID=154954 RepID=UPI003F757B71
MGENEANADVMEDAVSDIGGEESESGVPELRLKVESLRRELKECRTELSKLHKRLSLSERLQRSTESYNQDLRTQVDQLSAEIHERKKRDKERAEAETQTEEYAWTEADYYNYYYGDYTQGAEAVETQDGGQSTAGEEAAVCSEAAEEATPKEAATQPDVSATVPTEEGDGTIADMLRATAEEAMTQTGFVFDETSGMYYDHSTGFYYDSATQLYYDANTCMYYYYDADSGRYQFHSRIEVAAAQTGGEPQQNNRPSEKKSRVSKKGVKKSSKLEEKELVSDEVRTKEEETDGQRTKKKKRRSPSRDRSRSPRRKDSSKTRKARGRSSSKKKKKRNGSHSETRRSRKKAKKSKSAKRKKRKSSTSSSSDSDGKSEPEEGEITESEMDQESGHSSSSSSTSSSSPPQESPESEMETQSQEVNDFWPPCVRVTVVRSPVLQVGTLFILTADSPATIGREKDMDHAIRIPEMGVSKFHAEVHFDQDLQTYVLVDQGSQNGTVINGNRILQPKTKCEPQALMHGDEVKMGETVLSFHIHTGTDTCDGCEPGQVMAHLSKYKREEKTGVAVSKEDKEALRQKELKQMKAKYGLQSTEYEEAKALKNPKYKNRAEFRRQAVGSEGTFQRDDAPASVHQEISEVNKGRKMLEKMGWKKGDGLGKEGKGMKAPIELKIRKSQAGLGAGATVSVDDVSLTRSKNQRNWEKARERFADTCQPDAPSTNTQQSNASKPWIRAEEPEASTDALP